jgi:hypothetical protein
MQSIASEDTRGRAKGPGHSGKVEVKRPLPSGALRPQAQCFGNPYRLSDRPGGERAGARDL